MSILTIVLFVAGIFLLIFGADLLVRGASQMASSFGVPTLLIGLTVVAFGTSAPELAVSLQAAINGQGAITIGNVVGSNIANILLILGIASMFGSLPVDRQLLTRDAPIMVVASLLTVLLCLDGSLSRLDGLVLVVGLGVSMLLILRGARAVVGSAETPRPAIMPLSVLRNLALVAGGLALLVTGAGWLVDGAKVFAISLGVSELIIGLTIVAVGTSLPEIATSVIAGMRGERDIAVGNVVGSNTLNLLLVLGLTALISPVEIPVPASALRLDLPVMVGAALLCLPVFFTRYAVSRREGIMLLGLYMAYTLYLVLGASGSSVVGPYGVALALFVIPLVVAALAVRSLRFLAEERRRVAAER
ncbi:calcium/sodium antiporter [Oscillochloris sp. ZM17-4]|uniref:calcium/sodium antiporter n=1 Tax=Oscillochloris sp. ZM17-4 TaxID=2866714 RepID=UPI001C73612B|nr:calcium/sodium antiporter [Oscillochloris sp. ZM17-4]MBX0329417.1 calcium/sodium antiporter [Oscillochloris sp. ZM17-4]